MVPWHKSTIHSNMEYGCIGFKFYSDFKGTKKKNYLQFFSVSQQQNQDWVV